MKICLPVATVSHASSRCEITSHAHGTPHVELVTLHAVSHKVLNAE